MQPGWAPAGKTAGAFAAELAASGCWRQKLGSGLGASLWLPLSVPLAAASSSDSGWPAGAVRGPAIAALLVAGLGQAAAHGGLLAGRDSGQGETALEAP